MFRPLAFEAEVAALVAEQRLRRHQHQGLAEIAAQLAAQDVEIVGRRGAVTDLHVVFGAQLQVAFKPGRRVFRPLAFEAVRQQHHQARHAQPFVLARRNELIDHHLGAVGEVAELGLPQDQHLRFGQAVAVLKTEHPGLGKRAVQDLERRLPEAQVGKRDIAFVVGLIDEHRMAL